MFIVDDESIVRKGIRTSIDWSDYGIEITGEAANGQDAIEKMSNDIDILLTDIKMPVMSGLELSHRVKEKYPETEIVLLTAYEDFHYAKEAIKIGVKEYLMKPVNVNHLTSVLSRIKREVQNKEREEQHLLDFSRVIHENFLHIKSAFIQELMNHTLAKEQMLKKAKFYNLPLSGPYYQIFVITLDTFNLYTENMPVREKESLKYAAQNVAEEILNSHFSGFVSYGESTQIIGLANVRENSDIYDMCEEIKYYIQKHIGLKVSIGIGIKKASTQDLMISFTAALQANEQKVYKGKASIFVAESSAGQRVSQSTDRMLTSREQARLVRELKAYEGNTLRETTSLLISRYSSETYQFKAIQSVYIQYIFTVLNTLQEMKLDVGSVFGQEFIPHVEVNKFELLPELQRWLKQMMEKVYTLLDNESGNQLKMTVKRAIQFIEEHYDEEIRLMDIANHVAVSPTYFSRVFKEETGTPFIKWLNQYRVDKAKELLDQSWLKLYEVADKVGFHDYKHFSNIFKKITGFSPKDYRDRR